ncbi:type II toxin-antitoxin system VapC family toxin [Pyrofollis japonicus]|uniref:PIN domain-containing protein n=1 Tax=Pyrofollis japonicus TaxID=3060460 RepID=UPI00295B7380|nr:PIN domain-containing protein [Pyrofollis japonicus]BEP17382.1 type II toxin-antitoxin system VapC family toxin [Pyrofollis japonicus]
MTIYDTSIVIDIAKKGETIDGSITSITLIEYPKIIFYRKFRGNVEFPIKEDYIVAHRLQLKLMEKGNPQQATDLLIAAIAIRLKEELVTRDKDFEVIAKAAKELGYNFRLKLVTTLD